MKLHLPKLLLTALLTAIGASASHADDSTALTLGDVMYVGDSITHGVNSASYRWALHKIFVDNGVSYTETGYHTGSYSDNANDDFTPSGDSYRGVEFTNRHSANASQRTYETAGRDNKNSLMEASNIKNWLGLSTTTNTGGTYNGQTYNPDTFFLLLGTNDLLSDYKNNLTDANLAAVTNNLLGADNKSGDMGTIVDAMYQSNPKATVYVSSVPCWTLHENNNNNNDREHDAVAAYNVSLKSWVSNYNAAHNKNIVLVDVNRGMLDVASSTPFYGVSSMFNNPGVDGLHPNAQGDLIIAGNMARAMGIAGRTAGAERKAAEDFNFHSKGNTVGLGDYSWKNNEKPTAGFTAELQGFTFGNGLTDGWNTTDNFSFSMGNGTIAGTLNINEAYIQWGDTILFSENMSTLTENIRMAYITGDSANGINSGFYVWLGDMLIGEALAGTSSTLKKVHLSYSGSSSYTISALAMDSTGAYAPTSALAHLISAPAATAQGVVTVPDGVTVVNGDTTVANKLYANKGENTKEVWCRVSSGQYPHWTGAHTGGTLTGNVTMIFDGSFEGNSTAFGVVKPDTTTTKVTGNVTLQFDAADAVYGSFTGTNAASVVGAYKGDIGGTFKAVINAGTFQEDILGGIHSGEENKNYKIKQTEIYINGGNIEKNVYGGGVTGTIENGTSVVQTGGTTLGNIYGGGKGGTINVSTTVTITGGTINGDIYAGGSGGTINGNTALTIDGNLPTLHGDLLSAGGSGGTINGNATLTIKDATANNYIASIDKFTGTLSGGENVGGTSTLVFENTQLSGTEFAKNVTAKQFDKITLSNSEVGLGIVALTGENATISLTDSTLTVHQSFSSASGLTVDGENGSLILAGESNVFNGGITVEGNNTLTLCGDVAFKISGLNLTYSYDENRLKEKTNGLGNAVVSGLENLMVGNIDVSGVTNATVNGSFIDLHNVQSNNGTYVLENSVYYVMKTKHLESPPNPQDDRIGEVYDLSNGKEFLLSEVVHVGIHDYSGPAATLLYPEDTTNTETVNSVSQFYVGDDGVLAIMGDSAAGTAGDILESTQGSGDIILRTPGYKDHDPTHAMLAVEVDSKTEVTGNLYLSPYVRYQTGDLKTPTGVSLHLAQGADISSFKSVNLCYSNVMVTVDGIIGKSTETGGHINNLTANGSSQVFLCLDKGANEEIVLAGMTTLNGYSYNDNNTNTSKGHLTLDVNHEKSHVIINKLVGKKYESLQNGYGLLSYSTGNRADVYDTVLGNINATLDIESFEYEGYIYIEPRLAGSSLHINLNLKKNQNLSDSQIGLYVHTQNYKGEGSLTIKGKGTYKLSNGNSINYSKSNSIWSIYNFGVLDSTWTGTVEVNNLDASGAVSKIQGIKIADYGNENSTIHFKGFKGYLTDNATAVDIKPALVLENTYNEDGSLNMNGYEITGGYEGQGQAQTYKGNIRGTGDFVVSTTSDMTFNLQGDLSEWAADGTETPEFIVQKGTQALNFSGNATEVNAIIKVAPSEGSSNAALKVSVGDANSEHTTTFNESVVASSLITYTNTTAQFKGETTRIGDVNLGAVEDAEAAVIEHGMVIKNGNTVQGGEARNTVMSFEGEGSVSDAKLTNVVLTSTGSITELQEKVSINLKNLHAEGVYLSGAVNFVSGDTQDNFKFVETKEAFGQTYNEVRFESLSFNGMTLQGAIAELGYLGNITLTVADGIEAWKGTDAPTNVSILLKGFKVEGLTIGERMEGMFDPLQFNVGDAQVVALSEDTAMSVSQLLNYKSYREVYFVQQADGLFIRMSNIPEPTTATLSLLALAALASRRRRASR